MTIRNTVEADLDSILALIEQQPSVNTVNVPQYHDHVAAGMYRDAWNWVLEEDGKIQALAIWWGRPADEHPYSIDGLYFAGDGDPVPAWTALIRAAIEARPAEIEEPEYHIFLAADWRDDPETVAALEPRSQAAAAAGLSAITDRWRFDWRAEYGLPERSTRVRFEPADDEAFLDVFARVSDGSLDAATARDVARLGREGAARADLDGYKSMPGDRSWWRLGYDANDELIGFAMPSANAGGPVVGYVGVVPEHRGHGYVDDLLAEITHQLVETGAERIRSDTDFGNVPMAKSFERLGYRKVAVRRVLSFPESGAN